MDEEVFDKFPDVLIDQDNIRHFRGLLQRRLLINRCRQCGEWIYPHFPSCPKCWSEDVAPEEVSGRGSVYMFTFSYVGHKNSIVDGLDAPKRTCWAAIELVEREALRYLAPIVGCEESEIHIGMAVQLDWYTRNGTPLPQFRPVAASANSKSEVRV